MAKEISFPKICNNGMRLSGNKKAPGTARGFKVVGVVGFEPTTPWSQTRCANRTALYPELLLQFYF